MATKGALRGFKRLFVANRGEIAMRILRTAAEMQIPVVAVYPEDDAISLHVRLAGEAVAQTGKARIPVMLFAEGGGGRPGDIKPPGGNTSLGGWQPGNSPVYQAQHTNHPGYPA